MAAQSRGSVNVLVEPEKLSLDAIATELVRQGRPGRRLILTGRTTWSDNGNDSRTSPVAVDPGVHPGAEQKHPRHDHPGHPLTDADHLTTG